MLLRNCRALLKDSGEYRFLTTDIRITEGRITQLGENLSPENAEEVLDMDRDFVLPGLMNSHYHSYTNLLRGTSLGEPLEMWSQDTVELGRSLSTEEFILSAELGIIEMLKNGVTACIDHIPHLPSVESIAQVYRQTRFRVGLAPMIHNLSDDQILYGLDHPARNSPQTSSPFPTALEYERLFSQWIASLHDPQGSIQILVGINAPQRADDELLETASHLAQAYGLPIHCHVLESKWQKITADHTESPIEKLQRHHLLGARTSLAHGVWVSENELDQIRSAGATIIANPTSNAFLGSGFLPVDEYLEREIPLAMGSDGTNCGTNHNMIEILRFFLLLHRLRQPDHRKWLSPSQAMDLLLCNGHKILGANQGSIAIGARADLVFLDKNQFLNLLPETILTQLIFHSHGPIVRHVLLEGEFALRDFKVLLLDETAVHEKLDRLSGTLIPKMKNALKTSSARKTVYESGGNSSK